MIIFNRFLSQTFISFIFILNIKTKWSYAKVRSQVYFIGTEKASLKKCSF